MTSDDLSVWVSIASIAQGAFVIGAVIFTVMQLRQSDRARDYSSLERVFQELHAKEEHERRQRVSVLATRDPSLWSESERLEATLVADFFERVGFLIRRRFLRKDLVMRMYSRLIITSWTDLKPFVAKNRVWLQAKNYSVDFEWLAGEAVKYRNHHHL